MVSLHFVLATTHDEPEEPVTLTYTDGTEARAAYDEMRGDPTIKHARLYHNPVPNGGVYDGAPPPSPPAPEPEPETDPALDAGPPLVVTEPAPEPGEPEAAPAPGDTTGQLQLED